LIIILVVLCLATLAVGWAATSLPGKAERAFGPPAENLDAFQSIYLSARLLLQVEELRTPRDPLGTPRPFVIELGEPTFTITERLQEEGFIGNAEALRDFLVYSGLDTTLQAGEYQLSPKMNALEIAQAMQDATPTEVTFRILPGWRMEEIAEALPTSGLGFSGEEFLAIARKPSPLSPVFQELPPGAGLEGFLYPDSYSLKREITVQEFIGTLLEDFQAKVDPALQEGFQQQGLSLFQAVTLASIVQREAIVDDEMPLIASVFLNRLKAGMKLESDPTVQYALGYQKQSGNWWKSPLSLDDLKIDSPYNTYLYSNLPPGPIANPGLSALKAVAVPAQTPYYYFRAACDGSGKHTFSETFEEHQQNACP
jgi:UPF0755 protein